jgi:hypothetical protein
MLASTFCILPLPIMETRLAHTLAHTFRAHEGLKVSVCMFVPHIPLNTFVYRPYCTAVVPPGYEIKSGVLTKCLAGSFRASWKPAGDAGACIACGEGVKADATDRVTLYDIVTNVATQVPVTSSTDDCCKY